MLLTDQKAASVDIGRVIAAEREVGMVPLIAFVMAASEPGGFADMEFKDWRVACDNVRQCRAGTSTPILDQPEKAGPEQPNSTSIFVERGGEASASTTIKIEQTGQWAMRLVWHSEQEGIALRASDNFYVSSTDTAKVLDAIRRDQSLDLLDIAGRKVGVISLAGANAALFWMDDQQHRIGTVTALVRPGTKALSWIPDAPQLPIVHATEPSARHPLTPTMSVKRSLVKASSCDVAASPDDIEFERLHAHHTMALLVCPDNNDNPVGDVSVIDDARPNAPTPAEIPLTDGQSWRWDSKHHTLEDGMISHGMDCSYRDIFVWTGSAFETKEKFEICPDSGQFYEYRARVVYDR